MNALEMHKEFNRLFSPKKKQIEVKYIEVNDIYSEGWIPDVETTDPLATYDNPRGDFSGGSEGDEDR